MVGINIIKLKQLLTNFLNEDIGEGDLTSETIFSATDIGSGQFIAKDEGIVSGLQIIQATYDLLSTSVTVTTHFTDGDKIKHGDVLATVEGPIRALLTGERVILNLLQRLSAIATLTHTCIERLSDESIRICDTRKTTPGLRMLEKYAVRTGGGFNHRTGLYDGVMIKDNHIAFAGSITNAIHKVRTQIGHMVKIEVETESRGQVLEAVASDADVIMFDNQTPEAIKNFKQFVPDNIITEASGGITVDTINSYQGCGVDYISLGFLTHSAQALDISFVQKIK